MHQVNLPVADGPLLMQTLTLLMQHVLGRIICGRLVLVQDDELQLSSWGCV